MSETRLVLMMEVLSPDPKKQGEVVRYTHPYDVGAAAWWEAGITRDEMTALLDGRGDAAALSSGLRKARAFVDGKR